MQAKYSNMGLSKMSEAKGLIFNIQKYSIHDGPGIRTTVFLKGCPLRCAWCSNPESQSAKPQMLGNEMDSREYTTQQVVEICLQDKDFYEESGGGVTLSGGEPLSQPQFATQLLAALKKEGVHTAIETTGCIQTQTFVAVASLASLLLFDIKHYDSAKHKQGTGADNNLILENLKWALAAEPEVLVRIPVIPRFNAKTENARQFVSLLQSLGVQRVQLLPFHQMGDRKYTLLGKEYSLANQKPLHPEDLEEYRQIFMENGIEAFF